MLQAATTGHQSNEIGAVVGPVGEGNLLLANEVAIALRVSRCKATRSILKWVRDPVDAGRPGDFPGLVAGVIAEAIPLKSSPADAGLKKNAALWLSTAADYIFKHSTLDSDSRTRFVLACLLPLLRINSDKPLKVCLDQTKDRIGEAVVILAIADLLGEDFDSRFRNRSADQDLPWTFTDDAVQIDCALTAEIAKDCSVKLPLVDDYDVDEQDWIKQLDVASFKHPPQEWASPAQLWQLADAVASSRKNMLLPREWVESNVNWEKVGVWWKRLHAALTGTSVAEKNPLSKDDFRVVVERNEASLDQDGSDVLESIGDLATETRPLHEANQSDTISASGSQHETPKDANLQSTSEPEQSPFSSGGGSAAAAASTRRLPVAQVLSHNDPVFVGSVQRMIASVRSHQSSLSLATVLIEPEDSRLRVRQGDGLTQWQDRLIIALNDCPDLEKVLCFVTKDGEFLAALPDVERNEATDILRQEIMKTIGATVEESMGGLAGGDLPGRFYAGIGSVVCPSTTFEANQLIEAAQRCFTAARRQGSAAIKSIEVY